MHAEPPKPRIHGSTLQATGMAHTKAGRYDSVWDVLRELRKALKGWNIRCEGESQGADWPSCEAIIGQWGPRERNPDGVERWWQNDEFCLGQACLSSPSSSPSSQSSVKDPPKPCHLIYHIFQAAKWSVEHETGLFALMAFSLTTSLHCGK